MGESISLPTHGANMTRNLAVEFEAPRKNCRQLNYKHTRGKLIYTSVSPHNNKQHCYTLITVSLSMNGKKLLKRQSISFTLYFLFSLADVFIVFPWQIAH